MDKMLFIVNPTAGKQTIRNNLLEVLDLFTRGGYEVTVWVTQPETDLREQVALRAPEYQMVVCSGGDGTLSETVGGLVRCKNAPPLGYIPAGTVNDFATSLKLPKAPAEAARSILAGEAYLCDIGRWNQKTFSYVAAFGAFTEVVYETPQEFKNVVGRTAYVLEGIKRIGDLKPCRVRVEYGEGVIEDDVLLGMVSNSSSVGGFRVGTETEMDDGILEVMLVKVPRTMSEIQNVINTLLQRKLDFQFMYSFKTSSLRLTTDPVQTWTLDGEYGGKAEEVRISCERRAFRIMVPSVPKELKASGGH